MGAPAAREQIEQQLHDLSRTRGSVDPQDIIEVVESVMASMNGDRTSANLELRAEIEALADYISTAKAEIATIKADKINKEYLPAAADQLSAIVGATERATNEIFEAVETVEELTARMDPDTAEKVTDAVTRVYEACGFQDITGQRISKVVTALQMIEVKVQALLKALGEDAGAEGSAAPSEPASASGGSEAADDDLMNGPQLPGNTISQDDVDALLASFD